MDMVNTSWNHGYPEFPNAKMSDIGNTEMSETNILGYTEMFNINPHFNI